MFPLVAGNKLRLDTIQVVAEIRPNHQCEGLAVLIPPALSDDFSSPSLSE